MQQISVTPDEAIAVVAEMYPREYDRAMAELTIRKLRERIKELENQIVDAMDEATRHGQKHNDA